MEGKEVKRIKASKMQKIGYIIRSGTDVICSALGEELSGEEIIRTLEILNEETLKRIIINIQN